MQYKQLKLNAYNNSYYLLNYIKYNFSNSYYNTNNNVNKNISYVRNNKSLQ